MNPGHVYILTSPNCHLIKIGGTDHPPLKRIREINTVEPYRSLGPWGLNDFRQVKDWRAVEYDLHYAFRSKLSATPPGQRELFNIPPQLASERLESLNPDLIVGKPKVDRMFQDEEFASFLHEVFNQSNLLIYLDFQGAWTLSLFPSTAGGRYYTINIGSHEVAFSSIAPAAGCAPFHCLVLDGLVRDYPEIKHWVKEHGGVMRKDVYARGRSRPSALASMPRLVKQFSSSTWRVSRVR